MNCHRRGNLLWATAWVMAMGLIALTLINLRQTILRDMSTPEAQQDWDAVRAAAKANNEGAGPVRQRVPQSAEPPALVLMRDHFAILMGAAFVFGTALFVMTIVAVKGVLWRSPGKNDGSAAESTGKSGAESGTIL